MSYMKLLKPTKTGSSEFTVYKRTRQKMFGLVHI